jgi:transposase
MMGDFIGLDVSLKDTAVSIRRNGKRIWRGKCASDPQALAALIRKHGLCNLRSGNSDLG